MSTVYEIIDSLCQQKNITHGKLCDDLGYSRNTMAALKSGRSKTLKLEAGFSFIQAGFIPLCYRD